jgi:hypothetical protein
MLSTQPSSPSLTSPCLPVPVPPTWDCAHCSSHLKLCSLFLPPGTVLTVPPTWNCVFVGSDVCQLQYALHPGSIHPLGPQIHQHNVVVSATCTHHHKHTQAFNNASIPDVTPVAAPSSHPSSSTLLTAAPPSLRQAVQHTRMATNQEECL